MALKFSCQLSQIEWRDQVIRVYNKVDKLDAPSKDSKYLILAVRKHTTDNMSKKAVTTNIPEKDQSSASKGKGPKFSC